MTVRKIKNHYWVDTYLKCPGCEPRRVRKRSPVNTKKAAQEYERQLLEEALASSTSGPPAPPEVPLVDDFAVEFLKVYALANNKLSEQESKEAILRVHLLPAFTGKRLDQIGAREVEAYKAGKLHGDAARAIAALSPKTVNNHLTVLRKMLATAQTWGLVPNVPPFAWIKVPPQSFDFFSFEEADRLIAAADPGQWRTMVLVALKTGLRLGELLGLRWEDLDLAAGKLRVQQSRTRGKVGAPKNNKAREVPLAPSAVAALQAHRHLRGPLVFCHVDGKPFDKGQTKHGLYRAARKAGLRRVGWHVLRHTFASHLAMRGVSIKAIQELLGHGDLKMTLRYSHLLPGVRQDAVLLLDDAPPARKAVES